MPPGPCATSTSQDSKRLESPKPQSPPLQHHDTTSGAKHRSDAFRFTTDYYTERLLSKRRRFFSIRPTAALADPPCSAMKKNSTCDFDPSPQAKSTKDLQVQLVLALLLGVVAFVTFCVRCPPLLCCFDRTKADAYLNIDTTSTMASPVPSAQAPTPHANRPSDPTEYIVWMGSESVQDHSRSNSGIGWLGRLCGK